MKRSIRLMYVGMIAAMSVSFVSCGNDEDKPDTPPIGKQSVVGKWQKYARVEKDGSLSGGDPDEFWIFNANGSFRNEDSGNITATGTYTVDGDSLTIMSRGSREENFTGTFKIDGLYMDYTFTEIGDDDYTTYRFLKQ